MTKIPSTGLFRTGDILAGEKNPQDVRRQLDRWVKAGKITQLRREVYLLQKPYRTVSPHPFLTANLLRRASYISLQSALSHYGMIPEHVPVVTSVTGGRRDDFRRRSITREFLQARILLSLQDHGAFSNWAFVGGTAFRFLYNLPRYSEDLDCSTFSNTMPPPS